VERCAPPNFVFLIPYMISDGHVGRALLIVYDNHTLEFIKNDVSFLEASQSLIAPVSVPNSREDQARPL
jgi:hypothetical protein